MTEQQSSYRQILKATSIFGGVQVFNIIIQIIRSKIIAILLGPAGLGIMGLLTTTTGLISNITNFGIGTSAVKDIATANSTGDLSKISKIITVFRKLVWVTGILGCSVTLIFSPQLSLLTFGNKNYTVAFIWISITLLFQQLSNGQLVLLQGMRRLKQLANANLFGSALALIMTLPLYYYYKIDGIVPGLIGTSLITFLFSWFFSRKIQITKSNVSYLQIVKEGSNMLRMGFLISLSGLLTVGASYIIRIYISRIGGINQVGLYNAGFAIINTYVGLIFNAMATDYYPRLSIVAHNNKFCRQTINQQSEIAILILAPILIIFLVFINWVVILFYSKQFLAINTMIYWAAIGMFFKAVSWSIAFIFLAKGESKLFFWNELISNSYLLTLNITGYHFFGLSGLGISFLAAYIIYFIQVYFISKIKFDFAFDATFAEIFSIQILLAIACFLAVTLLPKPYPYLIGICIIGFSIQYSIRELDRRLGLLALIQNYRNK